MTSLSTGDQPTRAGIWHRLTRSQAEAEADELKGQVREAEDAGLTTIDCCTPGETVSVRGMVRTVTMRPRSNVPALEIELYDGGFRLVFDGRDSMLTLEISHGPPGARAGWLDLYSAHCANNEFADNEGENLGFEETVAYGIELFAPTS